MRIIGGHDYFDSAMGFGIDKTVVLNRTVYSDTAILNRKECGLDYPTQETVDLIGIEQHRSRYADYDTKQHNLSFDPVVIWFAGIRYGGIVVHIEDKNNYKHTKEFYWNHGEFCEFLHNLDAEIKKDTGWNGKYKFNARNIIDHFGNTGKAADQEWLIENGKSIAIFVHSNSHRNGVDQKHNAGWRFDCDGLKDFGFGKVLDAYSAFQNLSQWVGGVLPRPSAPMVDITDEKTQLQKHGMDKWSFKTMPGSKK